MPSDSPSSSPSSSSISKTPASTSAPVKALRLVPREELHSTSPRRFFIMTVPLSFRAGRRDRIPPPFVIGIVDDNGYRGRGLTGSPPARDGGGAESRDGGGATAVNLRSWRHDTFLRSTGMLREPAGAGGGAGVAFAVGFGLAYISFHCRAFPLPPNKRKRRISGLVAPELEEEDWWTKVMAKRVVKFNASSTDRGYASHPPRRPPCTLPTMITTRDVANRTSAAARATGREIESRVGKPESISRSAVFPSNGPLLYEATRHSSNTTVCLNPYHIQHHTHPAKRYSRICAISCWSLLSPSPSQSPASPTRCSSIIKRRALSRLPHRTTSTRPARLPPQQQSLREPHLRFRRLASLHLHLHHRVSLSAQAHHDGRASPEGTAGYKHKQYDVSQPSQAEISERLRLSYFSKYPEPPSTTPDAPIFVTSSLVPLSKSKHYLNALSIKSYDPDVSCLAHPSPLCCCTSTARDGLLLQHTDPGVVG
ncbi:hypothetical protein D9611_009394 [Ephemerocybe angulata]|uniref:Uncharacterized protein n=1 Tax=Ephemerocybe angulata TaxID=980116 RepID=A0A8H5BH13_9AGAR|nr:hypothetical protein D9611_009394 [Tulosesus angulatus]